MNSRPGSRLRRRWIWLLFSLAVVAGGWLGWRQFHSRQAEPPGPSAVPVAERPPEHPLDPALKMAEEGLQRIRAEIRDYTATLTKRERIGGKLWEQKLAMKVRQREENGPQLKVPMSVYLKFLEPPGMAGREVIWVENRDDGKLVAHEGGFKNWVRVSLPTNSMLAMLGNRYPITEIGIENLIVKLIERGRRERELGDCQVDFLEDQLQGDRKCLVIQITHPERDSGFDFYQAKIYIDNELNVPIRYSAYVWPEQADGEPVLDEEYIYDDLRLNVGLTDDDFDPDNKNYKYP
jgi:hypothetical protein